MRTVVVATFQYRYEAELSRDILQHAGIEAVVSADDAGGMELIAIRPVRLLVAEEEAEAAFALLHDAVVQDDEEEDVLP